MTDPCTGRHVEIKDGGRAVAASQVTAPQQPRGTARASLHAAPGHVAPGTRARLVDAVMDLPEVRASGRLRATVPLGDTESLWRLRELTGDAPTRPTGSTALVDADILPGGGPRSSQEPDGRAAPAVITATSGAPAAPPVMRPGEGSRPLNAPPW